MVVQKKHNFLDTSRFQKGSPLFANFALKECKGMAEGGMLLSQGFLDMMACGLEILGTGLKGGKTYSRAASKAACSTTT